MGIITVNININNVGTDTGPFDIYNDYNGLTLSDVSKQELIDGISVNVREQATEIIVVSKGICSNSLTIPIQQAP